MQEQKPSFHSLSKEKQVEQKKIFIVEDESLVALQIQNNIEKMGHKVAGVFASGEEMLDSLETDIPDLVLMDIKLQGELTGIETAERLHSRYDIPVIYLTAHSEDTTLKQAKETQPYGYLLKPFNVSELKIMVEIVLYKHLIDREKEQLLKDLKKALEKVKVLSGLLPICCSCKKIRDDKGYWNQIEVYIRDHSDAEFSHGLCPDCAKKLYGDYVKES